MLQLRRKFGQHLLLRAAQEKGPHAMAQPFHQCAARARARQRRFVPLAEIGRGAEIAGQKKIEERPEIEHRIFQRRAGEDQPVPRAQRLRACAFWLPRFLMCCASSRITSENSRAR